jgi:uncharacterized protein (TIGR02284 family)
VHLNGYETFQDVVARLPHFLEEVYTRNHRNAVAFRLSDLRSYRRSCRMPESTTLLRSLVQTTIDSAEGYDRAAEHAKAPELKRVLRDAAAKRRQLVADLNAELVRLGGERQERGSTSGAAHQIWTRISTAFKDKDEAAAERVEEGEDYIEKKFREALDNKDWEPATLRVLQQAHAQVKEGERLTDRLKERYD